MTTRAKDAAVRVAPSKARAAPAYHRRSAELTDQFAASGDGVALITGRTAAIDDLVLAAWRNCFSPESDLPSGFCLAAVGGYGRAELYPHSDVDLLLLFARQVGAREA